MDSEKAWEIAKQYNRINEFTEDEVILYEEALNYILITALEQCEMDNDFYLWRDDAEAAAFNLAFYYEKIGKFELALKYYTVSKEYGCDFADERIEKVKERM